MGNLSFTVIEVAAKKMAKTANSFELTKMSAFEKK